MADPIDELERLRGHTVGLHDTMPPAAEIRRLGDRRRRREQGLVAGAAAAAVAVVAVTGALAGGALDRDAAPQPAAPSEPPPSRSPSVTDVPTDIPRDFPLDLGALDLTGDGGELRGPAPGATGLEELEVCGQPVWDTEPASRLGFTSTGPETADRRELRVYPSAEEAVAAMSRLQELPACGEEPTADPGRSWVWRPYDATTGYATVSFGASFSQAPDDAPPLGGEAYVVTRVGSAVLALWSSGETSPDTQAQSVTGMTETARGLTPRLCRYTVAGCD
ncbi:hypothetical protein [Nocardioides donggukensis]|uniref:Uncharacterized protein n=1 Tax=Nocardioides donggukensis TaxID=2774019 RepID=A0A927K6B1_9ACTN|nr:hypothetical protein [Nocardioides donggukensis]MBD8868631.1 hypothetical protein [Nocardioides donggukensis]